MWIIKRLDISVKDIAAGMLNCFVPGSPIPVKREILSLMEGRN
jgi:hypothetical protein